MKHLVITIFFMVCVNAKTQITPAGFEHTKLVSWAATGISQTLDSLNKKQILLYISSARESLPNDANMFERPGIFVSDQQFQHQLHPHFKYTVGLSYRLQHHYSDQPPFDYDEPAKTHEIRAYSSISWSKSFSKFSWELTFKEDIRNLFPLRSSASEYIIKLRSRFKSKIKFSIDKNKIHQLILQEEVLFSTGKELDQAWDQFHYTDARLSAFYSFSPKKYPIRLEFGYMNNIRGIDAYENINILAANIIWINPFKYQ